LECAAVKRVREDFGLVNLQVMIPFLRTTEEAKKVLVEMEKNGLTQHENHLQVLGMCEVPSNVLLAEEFLDILDGFRCAVQDCSAELP
jgi:pyruvate,water dikinase